jgi:2-polyprenyl-6-methoxyphenol hydroxylase-like FAD-dependent oxidoreductase
MHHLATLTLCRQAGLAIVGAGPAGPVLAHLLQSRHRRRNPGSRVIIGQDRSGFHRARGVVGAGRGAAPTDPAGAR